MFTQNSATAQKQNREFGIQTIKFSSHCCNKVVVVSTLVCTMSLCLVLDCPGGSVSPLRLLDMRIMNYFAINNARSDFAKLFSLHF